MLLLFTAFVFYDFLGYDLFLLGGLGMIFIFHRPKHEQGKKGWDFSPDTSLTLMVLDCVCSLLVDCVFV